ncbi:hypothetical protein Tco_1542519, partial [Tanacetum coccineum]
HAEFDKSNTYVLERFDTSAGNPVKEVLLKLSLPDHRSILTDSKVTPTNHVKRQSVKVKEIQERCISKAFQDYQIKKGFFGRVTPLFSIMMVQSTEEMGADSATPTDSHSTPIITQISSSKPQKKSRRKQRKDSAPTEPITDEAHVSTPSYDPPKSGKDSMQLSELVNLEENQAVEKRRKSRPSGLRRLRKVGSSSRVESSNDASLGAREDASKQGRKIKDLDADAEVTLVNETQEMNDDNLMFDTGVLEE